MACGSSRRSRQEELLETQATQLEEKPAAHVAEVMAHSEPAAEPAAPEDLAFAEQHMEQSQGAQGSRHKQEQSRAQTHLMQKRINPPSKNTNIITNSAFFHVAVCHAKELDAQDAFAVAKGWTLRRLPLRSSGMPSVWMHVHMQRMLLKGQLMLRMKLRMNLLISMHSTCLQPGKGRII
jgi:hypothetical protein